MQPLKKNKKVYIETYGCQMNFSDSEIVASILSQQGYEQTGDLPSADILFLNTCSIRDNAEQRVRRRLHYFRSLKKKHPGLILGLLGCMAERTKTALMEEEQLLDVIAGPDSYRDLPRLLDLVCSGEHAVNTLLSTEETYADISPVRFSSNGVTAFISIMRGCENYCSYCVVPSARGRERSRPVASILRETAELFQNGFREVTLLGQNVNSYEWDDGGRVVRFAALLEQVAQIRPQLRIRFATSHPKDLSDELLHTVAREPNLCKAIHLPVQSGSNHMLDLMNRKYSREQYLERTGAIRRIIPGCSISTDLITGFCDETEEDHLETLSLMEEVRFDSAFMFRYSERPGTLAAERYKDNVPDAVKERRLKEIITLQNRLSAQNNRLDEGKVVEVLIESESKRSRESWAGRNSQNKMVVFPKQGSKPGEIVSVRIVRSTSATLVGEAIPG